MDDKIKSAIMILRENGYVVKRFTEEMQKDSDECISSGETKECFGCSCSMCVIQ